MKRLLKCHCLPTEENSKLIINYDSIYFNDGHLRLDGEVETRHVYWTSDEEIKKGDYFLYWDGYKFVLKKHNSNEHQHGYKIVCSSSKTLTPNALIPDDFLKLYAEKQGVIDSVVVEMEKSCNNDCPDLEFGALCHHPNCCVRKIATNSDNTVIWSLPESEKIYGEWISVKDRLPARHYEVLVFCSNSLKYHAWREDEKVWIIANTSIVLTDKTDITHWMPLPKPPISITDKTN